MNAESKKGRTNPKLLQELIKALHEIFPTGETVNPFCKIELQDYPTEYQYYLRTLTHYITLINQKHRAMEKQRFVTTREDLTASLNLMEITTLSQYRSEERQMKAIYRVLKQNTFENQVLTAKNIADLTGYKKSQNQKIIDNLLKNNLLYRIKDSHRNIGYLYRLKTTKHTQTTPKPTPKKETQPTKRDLIAEEIAEEFMDNQHYYKEL
jgi:DNA-binding MarR family transcriptional regulator